MQKNCLQYQQLPYRISFSCYFSFFMVSTTMREVTLKVNVKLPEATELSKLEKKSLVSYIYVGEPTPQYVKMFGVAPRIQLDDQFANVE